MTSAPPRIEALAALLQAADLNDAREGIEEATRLLRRALATLDRCGRFNPWRTSRRASNEGIRTFAWLVFHSYDPTALPLMEKRLRELGRAYANVGELRERSQAERMVGDRSESAPTSTRHSCLMKPPKSPPTEAAPPDPH